MKYVHYIALSLRNNQNYESHCYVSIQNCINMEPVGYLRTMWRRTGMQPQQWSGKEPVVLSPTMPRATTARHGYMKRLIGSSIKRERR